ncbi:hypothetical protein ACJQWK_01658 [Exserohilum turcicum]|uniref:Uncharacterized protein n=1 Tax=Exserohilum turcicum (strain 28A) TaxID=671987 RepID=R0IUE2_EXST2|nr:uncharacterized protein SETTUDRAFT_184171 [Exserohilum turcica Et28A]EOA88246.1 hypothetical protein SETTUDRAFT_184171 [Exserohilum turcica Et28A]
MPLFRFDGMQRPSHRSSRRSPSPPPSAYVGPYSGNPNTRYANPSYTGYDDPRTPSRRPQRRATHASSGPTHFMPNAAHYMNPYATTTTTTTTSRPSRPSHSYSYSDAAPPPYSASASSSRHHRTASIRDPYGNRYNHRDLSPVREDTRPRGFVDIDRHRRDVSPLGTSRFEQPAGWHSRSEVSRAREEHGLGISMRGSPFAGGEYGGLGDRSREGSRRSRRSEGGGGDGGFSRRSSRRGEYEMQSAFRDGGFSDWMNF